MQKAPNQYDTERLLSDALSHGDKTKLADALGVSLSEIAQQFNPDEPKKSDYYRFKRTMWALAGINREAAKLIYADLQASMDEWLGESRSTDIGRGIANVLKEAAELGAAQCEEKPIHVVKKEALDVQAKAAEVVSACERQTGRLSLAEAKR